MSHSTLVHDAQTAKERRVHWTNTDLRALISFDPTLADPKLDANVLVTRLRRAQEKALPADRQRASKPLWNFIYHYRAQFQASLKALILVPEMPRGLTYVSASGPQPYHAPVRWRANELRLIAESVGALLKPSLSLEPGALADAILRAQVRCLPPERHRTRGGIYQALFLPGSRNLRFMLCEALRQPAPAPLRAPAIVVAPPALAPAPAQAPAKAQAKPAPAPQAEPAKPSMSEMAERIAQHCMTLMRAEMADMLAMVVRTTLIDVLGAPASPAPVPPPPPPPAPAPAPVQVAPPPERPRRTRVDVVGLMGGQVQIVQQAVGDALDLRFVTADQAAGRVHTVSTDVVMCTKFVNHVVQNSIRARGGRIHYANGGAASVIDALRAIPAVQQAVASAH